MPERHIHARVRLDDVLLAARWCARLPATPVLTAWSLIRATSGHEPGDPLVVERLLEDVTRLFEAARRSTGGRDEDAGRRLELVAELHDHVSLPVGDLQIRHDDVERRRLQGRRCLARAADGGDLVAVRLEQLAKR